jgi:flagellar motor protein MotB
VDENTPPEGEVDPRAHIPPGRRKRAAAAAFESAQKAEFQALVDSIKGTPEEREAAAAAQKKEEREAEDRKLEREERTAALQMQRQMQDALLQMLHQMKDGTYSAGRGL